MPQIQFSMLLRLLYGCGLRLGEALTLKKLNVDRDKGVLFIRNAKGNRDRFVPMEPTLTNTLLQYCNRFLRNKSGDAYIFESTTAGEIKNCIGKPRTARWAQQNFRRVLKKAGVDLPELPWKQRNICLHCLRHTFIVRSFRKQDLAGIDNYDPAASISVYVGHHDLIETQRYLHMTAENSMDIINATNKYSKGIFPRIFVAPSSITGPQDTFRVKIRQPTTRESFFNDCSKGMFPGLPR